MKTIYVGFKTKIVNDFTKKRPYGYINVYCDNNEEETCPRFFATEKARDKAAAYDVKNYGYRSI